MPYSGTLSVGGKTSWAKKKVDVEKYTARGKLVEDWWVGLPALQRNEKERTGYPTQKPLAQYERIIKASSNEGDIVLDPFAGCATTCIAAERLGRQWVGIDIWEGSHELVLNRLKQTFDKQREEVDIPTCKLSTIPSC